MRRVVLTAVVLLSLLAATSVQAVTFVTHVFEPEPADLWDLPHSSAFTWGLDWAPYAEYEITEVTLTFHDIYNWTEEPNWLHIHLLDDPLVGTNWFTDGYASADDFFDGQGVHLDTWTDVPGGGPGSDLTYTFSDYGWVNLVRDFANDAQDPVWGLGIDPDCHFYNEGLSLTVVQAVPEPVTLALFGVGLIGTGLARRWRLK